MNVFFVLIKMVLYCNIDKILNLNFQAMALKDEETRRFLWGRADDESCVRDFQDKTNSSTLAQICGVFSRSVKFLWQG